MEAVEDAFLEGAILWLAQTILQSLFTGKLDEWIRQVGLADDAEKLKSEVERAEAVAAAVKGRTIGNRALARSLARLREVLYDADDVVDELDYYRLQHQVEGVTLHSAIEQEGMGGDGEQQVDAARDSVAMLPSSSDRKKRSKAWEEFRVKESADGKPVKAECIHCGTLVRCETTKGTSVLHNHLKSESCKRKRAAIEQTPDPPSAGDGAQNGATVSTHNSDIRKRMRIVEVSAHNTAAKTHAWTKAEFCNKIQQTTYQLRKATNEIQMLSVSGSVAYSNLCGNTTADPCRRTSSVVQCKMYGRVDEKNSIIKSMTEVKFDDVIIIPIVGIGGIGKTALSQLVYNDPIVKSQFDHRMWIWVSSKFDEVRLTMEMLDFVSQEKCVGIRSLAKLQEILVTHVTSNRTLVVLDDVWDDIDDCRWNKLLAPLRSDNAKGNVIIMTTRKLSIAKRICTVEPVKLGHLQNDDFWLLFKTCAFGDENYKEHPSLTIMGLQIAKNLHGNPQAAQTAGMLLREHLTTDHWSHILKNEKWKSLQLNGGIMHTLKLSYDELPFYLQQCFLYCSIFPTDHQFISSELIYIWIAQGFVKCSCSTERLEEMGQRYLTDLLNFGFFEQVETKDPTLGDKILYVMPALMHDFARLVSGNECAAIDDLTCREILPTIRHLSILTYSAYQEDKYGDILRNEKFEGKLQRVVNSTRKLRTLLLIGKYDCFFLQCLQGLFQKAQNLRALLISAAYADFRYSECNLVNSTHVRYLKLRTKEDNEPLPEALSKLYHLQVLDIGLDRYSTVHNGMNNLISLRHLVASKEVFSSISRIGKMTSLQELHDFKVDNCTSFEIAQLHSMSELAQLGVSQLEKVVTREEAYGANLRGKSHLEKLHLSWEYTSQHEYDINIISEPSYEVVEIGTSKVVLEGLEPHHSLKHLQISGYRSGTSPNWLVSTVSVTCLQTLHLEDCRELEVLPSVEKLPLLTKLKLRNMWKVRQVTVPSLEELVLINMPKLECCSCNSVMDLNSSLRVLKFEQCHVLKVFPLFESWKKLKIERKSWLSCVKELTICECPHLMVPNPLPPSSNVCKLHIARVSTLPTMEGSSSEELVIEGHNWRENNGLTELDDRILSFHNLRALSRLRIAGCQKLSSISLEGFRQLISLKTMDISYCFNLFSSDVPPPKEHTHEDMTDINFNALPSLKHLRIQICGITGMWLSVMLRHAPALEELYLFNCHQISGLLIEVGGSSSSNHTSAPRAPSAGNPDDALTSSTPDGLLRIPSNLIPSLKNMTILSCGELTFQGNKDGFSVFTSLEELTIRGCPKLIPSLVQTYENNDQRNGRWLLPYSLGKLEIDGSPETLQPCFLEDHNCLEKLEINKSPSLKLLQLHSCTALEELTVFDCKSLAALEGNFTCLKKLELSYNSGLESLQLRSCTTLEELTVESCGSLAALEDFRSLRGLRYLEVFRCPGLLRYLEHLSSQGYELCAGLERLHTDDYSFLTTCLTSLRCLELCQRLWEAPGLTEEQKRALQHLTSLQELRFQGCSNLAGLPVDLRSLSSLKRLEIWDCSSISRLPEKGLPPSLEEIEIELCSKELTDECRMLATTTRKPKVKIDGKYVN
ncbi:hypothetical protein SEVIR_7G253850v4 [Setaria viridis]|uniref:BED-type domain-containing protein n=1 Tax=Setaria viridis TaxID=4556 RepID=A0A4U6TV33_SETVI|nr:disease resistance protein RGA2-like isoform X2 [Setaria viridis]TKW06661.1 hypothetical protein SEVIR_7G253850v2 [Setaria viridis]